MQRILVLDDDEVLRDLLEALLSAEGFSVVVCASLSEALDQLGDPAPFDAVLTDLRMPGQDEQTIAQTLRATLPPQTALLGMSATEASPEVVSLFDGFLSKPFELQLLGDAIHAAQKKRAVAGFPLEGESTSPGNATDAASEVLDEKIFGSLASMISTPQLSELFAMALKDIGKRHTRMLEAAARGDLAGVQHEAHAVKGSCGMMGAVELQKLAAALEADDPLNTSALEEIPRACNRLQRMLSSKFPH